ncbi:MAG TPA: type II toxin-antitoxin system RelE/ParE family toxin [Candidatus Acidoferrales bacterium]|nr:type II toxin-antitoxin system RelE/ParE family toxin [Candidatus Acidoferrales bacterium]
MKLAIFHPAAREAIRNFPEDVRREMGKAIFDLQRGEILGMPVSRPMPSVAPGASELRIRDLSGVYRAFYYTSSRRGILVFHAFAKKTRATAKQDLHLGKKRLKELLHEGI